MSTHIPFPDMSGPTAHEFYGVPVPKPQISRFVLRVGSVAVGDVLQIDPTNTDGTSTAFDNTSSGMFSNLIAPRAGLINGTEAGLVVVVTDLLGNAGADNTDVEACWYGPTDAFVIASTGSVTFGEQLTVDTSKNFDGVKASGERIFGFCLEADTTTTSRGLLRVCVTNGWTSMESIVGSPSNDTIAT